MYKTEHISTCYQKQTSKEYSPTEAKILLHTELSLFQSKAFKTKMKLINTVLQMYQK